MARLPDETAISGPSIGGSGRPIASVDTTGYSRGADALARAVGSGGEAMAAGEKALGTGMMSAGAKVADVAKQWEEDDQKLEIARAKSDFLTQKVDLDASLDGETDHATLPGRYSAKLGEIQQTAAANIKNAKTRELFTLSTADDVARGNALADKTANKLWSDATLADGTARLEAVRQSALKTGDPVEAAKLIQTGNDLISSLADKGIITQESAVKYRQEWTTKYAAGKLAMLPADQRVDALRPAAEGRDAVLDRIGGIENSSGNPGARSATSSAMGDFQFINKTWLDTVKANRPDLLEGRTEKQVLDLRADPKLAREMAGYLLDANAAALQKAGVQPTSANLYLAHFLGPADAAAVLKAKPGTPVSDILEPRVIAANASVLGGKTTDTVIDWAGRKMAGGSPSSKLASLLPEDTRARMFNEAQVQLEQQAKAGEIDAARADAQAKRQAAMVSDQHENEILKQIYTDPSKVTALDVVNNDNLTREARERLTRLVEHVDKSDKTAATYGKGFYDLFERIHAPDGDPKRITDPAELYKHIGPEGDLTVSGMEKLRAEISGRRSPEGSAEAELKKQFFVNAHRQLSGQDRGLSGMRDPKGEELYLKFMQGALPAYDEGRKAGKSPAQLLNPDSADYIGKSVETMKRDPAVWFSDIMNAGPAPAAATKAFDITSIKTVEDAVKAHQAGFITGDQARAIAVEKGWARPRPVAPTDLPQVPRS